MLHFEVMTLNDFGPYKGEQVVDFTDKYGTTIFWGDNGRGKTTLLNAFRYALFGSIQRRNGSLKNLSEMENAESKLEGRHGFSVKITFVNNDDKYELTRSYSLRDGIGSPSSEDDYERNFFLKKNGSILSPDERNHELNSIMPEQISRFFLFDAELLQEYEELLEVDSSTGDRIKKSIEKILGMPVLQNGVVDITDSVSEYERAMTNAARKDDKTIQLAQKLEEIDRNISEHTNILKQQEADLTEMVKERNSLENLMSSTSKLRDWVEEKKSTQAKLKETKEELDSTNSELQGYLKVAWQGMLANTFRDIRENLDKQISTLESKKEKNSVAEKFIFEMKKAISDRTCPVCGQEVSSEVIKVLEDRINNESSEFIGLTEDERNELLRLQSIRSNIVNIRPADSKDAVKILENKVDDFKIKIGTYSQRISELEDDISRSGSNESETELETITRKYTDLGINIQTKRTGINGEENKLKDYKATKEKLSEAISKMGGGIDYKIADKRYQLVKKINNIFDESKTKYRDELKRKVEADASSIFIHLTGDKDYVGLQINDNYGLSIVHRSGRTVPGRSSGYEHIVALSLIGALHKNAPLQGPIIIDSPFGRLDPTNKANIVRSLPTMAEQTILLAYTGEIDAQVARGELGNNLLKEYKLERISSMHTVIHE